MPVVSAHLRSLCLMPSHISRRVRTETEGNETREQGGKLGEAERKGGKKGRAKGRGKGEDAGRKM